MKKSQEVSIASPEYRQFIEYLKTRVVSARISAARAVSSNLILLYWDIGRSIVEKQQVLGWGDTVVHMVAADLHRAFPEMRGFSPANVWRMRQLHMVFSSEAILAQAARELENHTPRQGVPSFPGQVVPERKAVQPAAGRNSILAQAVRELAAAVPWGHLVLLLGRIKSPPELFYYLRATARFGWSRNVLLNQINDKERGDGDQPSIGIILCAEKDDVEVEYALRTKENPIGVAAYQLQSKLPADMKGKLPTAKQLADVVRAVLPGRNAT